MNIGFVPKRGNSAHRFVQAEAKKNVFEDCKNVVYSVPCAECGLRYLGETGQHFCERRKQHEHDIKNRKTTNGFYEHSRGKVGYKPDWRGTVFVAKEKHWRARKIKEAIQNLINALNPTKKRAEWGNSEFRERV